MREETALLRTRHLNSFELLSLISLFRMKPLFLLCLSLCLSCSSGNHCTADACDETGLRMVKRLKMYASNVGPTSTEGAIRSLVDVTEQLIEIQEHEQDCVARSNLLREEAMRAMAVRKYNQFCHQHYEMNEKVEIKPIDDIGLALIAKKQVEDRELILQVFENQTIYAASQEFKCLKFKPQLGRFDALKLLQLDLNGAGFFQPYIDILPRTPIHPYYFSSNEWTQLRKSNTFPVVLTNYRTLLVEYAQLHEALRSDPACAAQLGLPLHKVTLAAFRWAVTMVKTRAVDGGIKENEVRPVLMPCRDSMNHDANAYAVVTLNNPGPPMTHYKLFAVDTIERGEIRDTYASRLAQSTSLVTYGFPECYLHVFRPRNLDNQQIGYLAKSNYNEKRGIPMLRLTELEEEEGEEEMISESNFALMHKLANLGKDSDSVALTWRFLAVQIRKNIESYPHSLEEYKKLAEEAENPLAKLPYQQMVCELELLQDLRQKCSANTMTE